MADPTIATYKQFTTLADAQAYAAAQTVLAALPAGQVTTQWSDPTLLADGTYVVQCFSDDTAVPWQDTWVLPTGGA
jgi:hypothetical protein